MRTTVVTARGRAARKISRTPSSPEEIVAKHHRHHVSRHPFFVALARGPVDLGAVWVLMANLQEGISAHFVRWLARTIERVTDRRVGSLLAKQLNDELGDGDVRKIHSVLLERFVSGLAPWRPTGTDEILLRAGRHMAEACGRPFVSAEPYEGVGALIVGEIFAEKMDLCLAREMRRQSDVRGDSLTWLDIHEKLEHEHAEDSNDLAVLVPREGPQLAAAWRGAEEQWQALWSFLDEVHATATASSKESSRT